MQTTAAHSIDHSSKLEQRRYYRIERRYVSQRRPRELIRDLFRAHSGQ